MKRAILYGFVLSLCLAGGVVWFRTEKILVNCPCPDSCGGGPNAPCVGCCSGKCAWYPAPWISDRLNVDCHKARKK